jgi:two-component system nitrate/nitrite response regulator NarL
MNAELTERQRQVLKGIAKGYSNQKIAEQLELSSKTVKAHVTAIFRALKVSNRTEAALAVMTDSHCATCTCNSPANAP